MQQQPRVFVLSPDLRAGSLGRLIQGAARPDTALLTIARTLSTSPLWDESHRAVLVMRCAPRPLLGILGYFDAAAEARLEMLCWQLTYLLPCLRYISYAQAEADCERLAAQLVVRFGAAELRRWRFAAIPRGGFIVLGMLAYVLGLDQAQMASPHPADAPLVVVDDCALTGVRFGAFLEQCSDRDVVFVHLYSHPDLRAAIQAQEPRVIACLSAHDLRDHAPERLGDQYAQWRENWLHRSGNRCYWVGQPDYICFAWNEPDITFWNPVTAQEESAWRFVPPELCLKNRPARGTEPISVQAQPEGKGPLKPAAHVLFGDLGDQIVIGNVKTGQSYVIQAVAAAMWRAIIAHGNLEDAAQALWQEYDVHAATLHADLRMFTTELRAQDLLAQTGGLP